MTKSNIFLYLLVLVILGLGSFGLARDYAIERQEVDLEDNTKIENVVESEEENRDSEDKKDEIATSTPEDLDQDKFKNKDDNKEVKKSEEIKDKTEPAKTSELIENKEEPKKVILNMTELAKHNDKSSCWLLLSGKIYDVTDFVSSHPGGAAILQGCGKDATTLFETRPMGSGTPHSDRARAMQPEWFIGNFVK